MKPDAWITVIIIGLLVWCGWVWVAIGHDLEERDIDCKSLGGHSVKTTYGVVCAKLDVLIAKGKK